MPRNESQHLGSELAQIKRAIKDLQAGRLQNASMHGSRLYIYDDEGDIREVIGNQGDGSYGSRVVQSPPQPTPTAPILTAGELGSAMCQWDGGIVAGTLPVVHGRVDVFAQFLGKDGDPDESEARIVSSIRDRDGGATTLALGATGRWAVWLRMVGADRTTMGDFSEPSIIDIEAHVDAAEFERIISEAQGRIDNARAQLQASMQELDQKLAGAINDRLKHSTEQPPSDYDGNEGDVWRVVDGSGTVIAEYERVGDQWEPRTVSSEVIHNLDVGKLTAGSGEFAEAVIGLIWAQAVRAKLLEADEAIIGGALIRDGAIDVEKLHVTEEMTARIGQFLHLQADQIDVNSLVTQSALVGLLEAYGMVLSDEGAGRRFTVSGQGWRLEDTDTDQTIAQLGLAGDDLISLHDSETGEPVITMTQDGGLSARHVSTAGDPTLGGKPLFGALYDTPKWHAASSGLASIGQGVVAQHLRTFNGETSTAQSGTAVAHLEANLVQGRYYRIRCHGFQAGDNGPYYMEAYYTTSQDRSIRPALPNSSSVRMGQQAAMQPSTGAANLSFDFVYPATTAERIRVLFVVGRFDGNRMNFGSSLRHNARFTIEDLGPMTGSQGHTLWRTPASTLDNIPAPPEMLRQTYPVAQTATYSFNSSTGVATRLYTGGQARFGTWTVTGQTHFTVVQYQPWSQVGGPRHVDVSFRVGRWATTRGNIVRNWLPSFSGTPATFHIDDLTSLETQRNVGLGDIRGATLSESRQFDLADRPNASLVLGGTGWETSGHAASGVFSTSGATAGLSTELEPS